MQSNASSANSNHPHQGRLLLPSLSLLPLTGSVPLIRPYPFFEATVGTMVGAAVDAWVPLWRNFDGTIVGAGVGITFGNGVARVCSASALMVALVDVVFGTDACVTMGAMVGAGTGAMVGVTVDTEGGTMVGVIG